MDNSAIKKQLSQEITSKSKEMSTCTRIKRELSKEKGNLEKHQEKWKKQYQKHNNSKVAKKVVIKNVFEGTVANKLKDSYGDQVNYMCKTSDKADKLSKELEEQIRKLENYISGLQNDIESTQSRLDNMED